MTKLAQILLYSTHILQHRIKSLPRFLFWQDDTTSHEIFFNDFTWLHFPSLLFVSFPFNLQAYHITGPRMNTFRDYEITELYYKVGRVIGRHRHLFTLIFLLWR